MRKLYFYSFKVIALLLLAVLLGWASSLYAQNDRGDAVISTAIDKDGNRVGRLLGISGSLVATPNQNPASLDRDLLTTDDVGDLLEEGEKAIKQGEYSNSLYIYNRAVFLAPRDYRTYYGRAWAKIGMGITDYDNIISDLRRSLNANNSFVPGYNARGLVSLLKEDYQSALRDFSIAVRLDANYIYGYINRAYTKYQMKDYNGAVLDYSIAITLSPNAPLLYNNRAMARYGDGQLAMALHDLNQAIALNDRFATAFSNRAIVKKALGMEWRDDLTSAEILGEDLNLGL